MPAVRQEQIPEVFRPRQGLQLLHDGIDLPRPKLLGFPIEAGVAWANIDYQSATGSAFLIDVNHQRTGLTGGAGFEYALTNDLSARVEYDYLYFGSAAISLSTRRNPSNVDHQLHLLKLGVNYRFNSDPIVARY